MADTSSTTADAQPAPAPQTPKTPPAQTSIPDIQTVAATPLVGQGEEFAAKSSAEEPATATAHSNPSSSSTPPRPLTQRRSSLSRSDSQRLSPAKSPTSPTHAPISPSASNGSFSLSPPLVGSHAARRNSSSTTSSTSTFRIKRKPAPSEDGISIMASDTNHSVVSLSVDSALQPRRSSVSSPGRRASTSSQARRPSASSLMAAQYKNAMSTSPSAVSTSPSAPVADRPRLGSSRSASHVPQLSPQGAIKEAQELDALSGPSDRPRSRKASNASRPATATDTAVASADLAAPAKNQSPAPSRPATAPAGANDSAAAFTRKDTVMVDGQAFFFGGEAESSEDEMKRSEQRSHAQQSKATTDSAHSRRIVGKVVDLSVMSQNKANALGASDTADSLSRQSDATQHSPTSPARPIGINPLQRLEQNSIDSANTLPKRTRTQSKRIPGRAESTDGIATRSQIHAAILPRRPGTASGAVPSMLPFRKGPLKRQSPTSRGGSINSSQQLEPPTSSVDEPVASGPYAIEPPSRTALEDAAALNVFTEAGELIRFGEIFADRRTLVCFLRHWFCPMCQEFAHSIQKIDPLPLQRANLGLVVVGQGHPHVLSAYKKVTGVPDWVRMYADPTRKLYKALGMTLKTNDPGPQCAKPDYIQMSMLKGSLKAIRNGLFEMPLRTPGDLKLLGGEFIFGPGIQCSFTHRMVTTRGHLDLPRVLTQAGCDMSLQSIRAIGEESNRPDDTKSLDRVRARKSLGRTVKQIARNFEAERKKSLASTARPASRASTLRRYSQDIPAVPKLPAAAAFESSRILSQSVSTPHNLSTSGSRSSMKPRQAQVNPRAQAQESELQETAEEEEDADVFGRPARKNTQLSLEDAVRMGPPDHHTSVEQARQRRTLADGPARTGRRGSIERATQRSHGSSSSRRQSEDDSGSKRSLKMSPAVASSTFSQSGSRKKNLLDVTFDGIRKTTSTPDLAAQASGSPRTSISSHEQRPVFKPKGSPLVNGDSESPKSSSRPGHDGQERNSTGQTKLADIEGNTSQVRSGSETVGLVPGLSIAPSAAPLPARQGGIPLTVFERQIMAKGRAGSISDSSSHGHGSTPRLGSPSPRVDDGRFQESKLSSSPSFRSSPRVNGDESQSADAAQASGARQPSSLSKAFSSGEQPSTSGSSVGHDDGERGTDDNASSSTHYAPPSTLQIRRESLNKSLPSLPINGDDGERSGTSTPTNAQTERPSTDKYYSGAMALSGNGGGGSFLDDLDVVDGFTHNLSASTSHSSSMADQRNVSGSYPRESFDSWAESEAADSDSEMEHEVGWVRPPSGRMSGINASPSGFVGGEGARKSSADYRPSMDSNYTADSRASTEYRDSASYGRPSYDASDRYYSDEDEDGRSSRRGGSYDTDFDRRDSYDERSRRDSEEDSRSDYTASPEDRDPARDVYKSNVVERTSTGPRTAYSQHPRVTNGYLPAQTLDTFDEEDEEDEEPVTSRATEEELRPAAPLAQT